MAVAWLMYHLAFSRQDLVLIYDCIEDMS